MRLSMYRGWGVVAALFVGGFMLYGAGLYSFILFVTPLSEEFHWSHAVTGSLVSAFWLSAPLSLAADPLIRRFGSGRLVVAGILLEGLCLVALSFASQLWHMYALRALAGVGKVMYAVNMPIIVSKWFSRRFGTAIALMYSGWHVGGLVLTPVASALIQSVGWRSASAMLGVSLVLIALPPTLWAMRVRSAADIGLPLDGLKAADAAERTTPDRSPPPPAGNYRGRIAAIFGVRSFPLILFGTIFFYLTNAGVLVHQSAILEKAGVSTSVAAWVLSATAGLAAVGAFLIGQIADRFSLTVTTLVEHALMACGVACLLSAVQSPSTWLLAMHAVTFGLAIGGTEVYFVTLLLRQTPKELFQPAWSVWYFLILVISVVGPIVTGRLYDVSSSYTGALLTALLILIVPLMVGLFISFRRQGTGSQNAAAI